MLITWKIVIELKKKFISIKGSLPPNQDKHFKKASQFREEMHKRDEAAKLYERVQTQSGITCFVKTEISTDI